MGPQTRQSDEPVAAPMCPPGALPLARYRVERGLDAQRRYTATDQAGRRSAATDSQDTTVEPQGHAARPAHDSYTHTHVSRQLVSLAHRRFDSFWNFSSPPTHRLSPDPIPS